MHENDRITHLLSLSDEDFDPEDKLSTDTCGICCCCCYCVPVSEQTSSSTIQIMQRTRRSTSSSRRRFWGRVWDLGAVRRRKGVRRIQRRRRRRVIQVRGGVNGPNELTSPFFQVKVLIRWRSLTRRGLKSTRYGGRST